GEEGFHALVVGANQIAPLGGRGRVLGSGALFIVLRRQDLVLPPGRGRGEVPKLPDQQPRVGRREVALRRAEARRDRPEEGVPDRRHAEDRYQPDESALEAATRAVRQPIDRRGDLRDDLALGLEDRHRAQVWWQRRD